MLLDATEGFDHLPGVVVEEVGLAELLCLRLEAELQSAQDQHLRVEAAGLFLGKHGVSPHLFDVGVGVRLKVKAKAAENAADSLYIVIQGNQRDKFGADLFVAFDFPIAARPDVLQMAVSAPPSTPTATT